MLTITCIFSAISLVPDDLDDLSIILDNVVFQMNFLFLLTYACISQYAMIYQSCYSIR